MDGKLVANRGIQRRADAAGLIQFGDDATAQGRPAIAGIGPGDLVERIAVAGRIEHQQALDRPPRPAEQRCLLAHITLTLTDPDVANQYGLELGRGSCRERVCQYDWISVVGDSYKKTYQ